MSRVMTMQKMNNKKIMYVDDHNRIVNEYSSELREQSLKTQGLETRFRKCAHALIKERKDAKIIQKVETAKIRKTQSANAYFSELDAEFKSLGL
jgi:trans-aconitate methyltransferase